MTWWWAGMAEPAGQALWLAWGVVAGVATGGELCRRCLTAGLYRSIAQYLPPVAVLLAGLVVLWPVLPGIDLSGPVPDRPSPPALYRGVFLVRGVVPDGYSAPPERAALREVTEREGRCDCGNAWPLPAGCGCPSGLRNKVME
ncbi:hypothetical protein DEO48_25595 [Enterobacter sp. CGMCC 5087]|uniref:hypothetical protein n=1 Tax=Enterobacter sp. CGMCC 5087 TaxID=2183878 RepID=UPI000D6753DF|nr:hypothetical protein [Enterobacter sp. CGMCC 5087]PWI77188.1 hypothetical protein DEO48_25595 [Enterobacter sp. CGMCC 5087]